MILKSYEMTRIVLANIISVISLASLIVFGVTYLKFKNTPIYENYRVEIVNNPITGDKNIEFVMVGKKTMNCTANKIYAVATNSQGDEVILDRFVKTHIRNVSIGDSVTNNWTLAKPDELHPGVWRVDMVGHWECSYFVFSSKEVIRNQENILLIVE